MTGRRFRIIGWGRGEIAAACINFGLWGRVLDVINYAKFQRDRFRGFGAPGSRKLLSPIDWRYRPYSSVWHIYALTCYTVIQKITDHRLTSESIPSQDHTTNNIINRYCSTDELTDSCASDEFVNKMPCRSTARQHFVMHIQDGY